MITTRTNSLTLLGQLHWLPVEFSIRFKLAHLTYKILITSIPTYLKQLVSPYIPPHSLQSLGKDLLTEPQCRTVMGSCEYHVAAPNPWNRLMMLLRCTNSFCFFKQCLKTHNFTIAVKYHHIYCTCYSSRS